MSAVARLTIASVLAVVGLILAVILTPTPAPNCDGFTSTPELCNWWTGEPL